jgi:hypothetical protein
MHLGSPIESSPILCYRRQGTKCKISTSRGGGADFSTEIPQGQVQNS